MGENPERKGKRVVYVSLSYIGLCDSLMAGNSMAGEQKVWNEGSGGKAKLDMVVLVHASHP